MSKTGKRAQRTLRTFYSGTHAITLECDKHANTVEHSERRESGEYTHTLESFSSEREAYAHYARCVRACK